MYLYDNKRKILIEVKIDGARGVLFSIAGGYDMAMSEIQEAAEVITGSVAPDANIIFGASIRPELEDEIVVTVVATGFDSEYYRKLDMEQNTGYSNNYGGGYGGDTASMSNESYNLGDMGVMRDETPVRETPVQDVAADFTSSNKTNMWDSIRTENEDDLDVPPTLRERFRNKNRE